MKYLIAYASKTGSTRDCAGLLEKELRGRDVTLCDLSHEKPELDGYDVVVIGTPIRFGKAMKSVLKFIDASAAALAHKRVACYICCAYADRSEEYIKASFPAELLERATACASFGGDLKVGRQNSFLSRVLVRFMRSEIENGGDSDDESQARILPEIATSEIAKFADKLKLL